MSSLLLLLALFGAAAADFTWNVTDALGNTCVLLQFKEVHFKIYWVRYPNAKANGVLHPLIGVDAPYEFDLKEALVRNVRGDCFINGTTTRNEIEVDFQTEDDSRNPPWTLRIWFGDEAPKRTRRGIANEVHVSPKNLEKEPAFQLVDFNLDTAAVVGVNLSYADTLTKNNEATLDWKASDLNAFKCSKTGLSLFGSSKIDFTDLKVIASAKLVEPKFPENQQYETCPLDSKTSDAVPIIVGICLAALVIAVLVAYLIGRARARRTGYASV